uniref:Uncharacterized protein n=1 Tax=Octopus bimaculoides TaxID=37653 RepID=A0A0L8FZU4_OCTBM
MPNEFSTKLVRPNELGQINHYRMSLTLDRLTEARNIVYFILEYSTVFAIVTFEPSRGK